MPEGSGRKTLHAPLRLSERHDSKEGEGGAGRPQNGGTVEISHGAENHAEDDHRGSHRLVTGSSHASNLPVRESSTGDLATLVPSRLGIQRGAQVLHTRIRRD